ncbi:GNAT family N-acetyltransferase [Sphingopyxis witflariensis]|uniref:N-acetyltransferase domain-containing protein n=1 Tax=Sphingopyxis witflariensis TaxID=173675 RepID=A0A246JDB6_9SPHN|nr:GNAT family N-acetyltransferase [Sphingopyxis witflariensis]OWQ90645.1 hypothetical protein CDQ91_20125 [Sphingopyxis witflariensis]
MVRRERRPQQFARLLCCCHHAYAIGNFASCAGVIAGPFRPFRSEYASEYRARAAYRTSVDVAVYVAPGAQRSSVARCLYSRLLPAAASLGHHAAFADIALPNKASLGLHEAMGFEPVGNYREVGRKFDAWHDVGWWQRLL